MKENKEEPSTEYKEGATDMLSCIFIVVIVILFSVTFMKYIGLF